ncbi:MAG: 7TM diverse intracellular signaling domain-containing protein [Leptospirales bacterium]
MKLIWMNHIFLLRQYSFGTLLKPFCMSGVLLDNKVKFRFGAIVLTFLTFIFFTPGLLAQETKSNLPVLKTSVFNGKSIGSKTVLYVEKENAISFKEISQKKESEFVIVDSDIPSFGITTKGYWLKSRVVNDTNIRNWFFEIKLTQIDQIRFVVVRDNQKPKIVEAGQNVHYNDLDYKRRNPTFPVSLEPGEQITIYIYIQDAGMVSLPMYLSDKESFLEMSSLETFMMGLFFGTLIIMLLYNLFLFFGIKDISYLYYCVYLTGIIFVFAIYRGYGDQYLWPDSSIWWKNYSGFLASNVGIGGVLLFMGSFLNVTKETRFIYYPSRFLLVFIFISSIVYAFLPLKYYMGIWVVSTVLGAVIASTAGVYFFIQGYKPARYYLLAWTMLLIGMIAFMLKFAGVLPTNLLTEYGMQFSNSLEAFLLSIALADRIKSLQEERGKLFENVSRLNQKLLTFQEVERNKIAGMLHDDFGQSLATVQFKLGGLSKQTRKEFDLDDSVQILKNTMTHARNFSHSLVPAALQPLGLENAIQELIQGTPGTNSLLTKVRLHPVESLLSPEQNLEVFRIIQESLFNTIKHAHAYEFQVLSEKLSANMLRILITDDGVGIPKDKSTAGLGLHLIQERIKSLKGNFIIDHQVKTGTRLQIDIPY